MAVRQQGRDNVALSVTQLSQLPLAMQLARRFRSAGTEATLVSNATDASLRSRMSTIAARHGLTIEFIHDGEHEPQPLGRIARAVFEHKWFRHLPRDAVEDTRKSFFAILNILRGQSAASRAFLRSARPSSIIVFEDNLSSDRPLIAAASHLGIPVVDCPYEISGAEDFDRDIAEKFSRGEAILVDDDPCGGVIRRRLPSWIRRTDQGSVLPFAGFVVLAYEAAGLKIPTPWLVHAGSVDVLVAESDALAQHYRRLGFPPGRIRTLGSAYADVITEEINQEPGRQAAYETCSTTGRGALRVLISLPPSYHGTRAMHCAFPSYEQMLREVRTRIGALRNIDMTVSVHPNTAVDDQAAYGALFDVSDQWLIREIPRCDVFLTCQSSTIRWAICARKPVINWDLYEFAIALWDRSPGVLTTRSLDEVVQHLRNLSEPAEYERIARLQAADAAQWGMMDGRNFDRLSSLLTDMRRRTRRW